MLPFLLLGAAVVTGGFGIKKSVDATFDIKKSERLNREAKDIFDSAKDELSQAHESTKTVLLELGELKLDAWKTQLGRFVKLFEQLKNVELAGEAFVDRLLSDQELAEMKDFSYKASLASGGAAALGASAMVGVAVYGGAGMLATAVGTASTGAAIGSLSGTAAANATLAWFGGGSLAAGGFGMAGGVAVLGGIVAGPVLAVGGMVFAAKARENLAHARSNNAKAKLAAAEMKNATAIVKGIGKVAQEFCTIIRLLSLRMATVMDTLEGVMCEAGPDYSRYDQSQKEKVYLAVQFAQGLKVLLETPILTEEGGLTRSYPKALEAGRNLLKSSKRPS